MNEVLTRAEMEARFNGEWVLIADPEMDENMEVIRGRVISHGRDADAVYADAVYQEATDQNVTYWASLCFQPMPKHVLLSGWKYLYPTGVVVEA